MGRPSITRPIWERSSHSKQRPGATLWVATYPRQEPNSLGSGNGSERDLNPAIVEDSRVFVAPSDADSVLAFDAGSGRLLWKSDPIADDVKLSHLLGVAKDRLVATGNRVLLFDVKTGKLLHAWPDSGRSLEGYGRGLLAGDLIYWPTVSEIEVLDQRTALRAEPPIRLVETYHAKGGNLVAGDGYLIVAQADGLMVFCQNSRLIERYQNEIALAPDRASNYFRLARAAEAIGRDPLALEMYEQAARRANAGETIDGKSLVGAARDHRFRMLFRLAGSARKARRWDDASAYLDGAATVARSDAERLQAQLLRADVLLDAAPPSRGRRHLRACLKRRAVAVLDRRRRRWTSHSPRRSFDRRSPKYDRARPRPRRFTKRMIARPPASSNAARPKKMSGCSTSSAAVFRWPRLFLMPW